VYAAGSLYLFGGWGDSGEQLPSVRTVSVIMYYGNIDWPRGQGAVLSLWAGLWGDL
jgi:hypothetical protein